MSNWLNQALDMGFTEQEFWEMTLGELHRAIMSHNRVQKKQAQERAVFDYTLAELIGRSVARLYSSTAQMPELHEVYPKLFDAEELEEQRNQKKAELSAMRFRLFANSFNKRIEEVAKN